MKHYFKELKYNMAKYTILHNPRCSKSRFALQFLEQKKVDFDVIEYQKWYLTIPNILHIQKLLWDMPLLHFLRKNEKEFWDLDLNKKNESEILKALTQFPNLLQRPIVIKDNTTAIIWRDEESLKIFIN